jgi:putative nucleotidyltransferase with HDIG domain
MGKAAETLTSSNGYYSKDTRALMLMASALGLKDRYTHAHAHRVAQYAKRLALRAELPMVEVLQVAMGGMLHDVGKLALSDQILCNRQAALTDDMLAEVRNHPLVGAALLEKYCCAQAISDAVLFHHERNDGSGYPFGLKDEEIPLSAKIVSIADCFDAMTTDRPYQRRKSRAVATKLLTESAGARLDAVLVPLFIKEIQNNGMAHHK